ncbi:MAG: TRAP transporter large permease subunit [Spirochaetes bacterium]|nr:TRAP transporter large permease subunit [Spirochaetota bacterium]
MKKLKNILKNTVKNSHFKERFFNSENIAATVILILLAVLPSLEVVLRKFFRTGLRASSLYIQHLVLWITFVSGMITSREGKHLSLSAGIDLIKKPYNTWIKTTTSFITIAITFAFSFCALSLALIGFDPNYRIGLFPIQYVLLIMPVAFFIMTLHFIKHAPPERYARLIAASGMILGLLLVMGPLTNSLKYILDLIIPESSFLNTFDTWAYTLNDLSQSFSSAIALPFIILIIISAMFGTPIFIVLGGLGLVLFLRSGGSIEVIPNEAYTMLTGPAIPAIPLFTLAGFILSESKAGDRLVNLFRSLFGWLPGGMAIMAIVACAFFTTFTGASGVTILALGGLLSFMMIKKGYNKKFTTGLLTASGSSGLLFPPSLPLIMYGVIAQINIKKMFVAGIFPGVLMLLVLIIMAIMSATKSKIKKVPFQINEIWKPLKNSLGEILLPVIILVGFFMGITTLVETSAITVLYALVLEVFIHRDIKIKDLIKVFSKSVPVIGGVLMILALAKGFSYYIVDAEVPMKLTQWCQTYIHSKYVFLMLVNVALLITGCFMDIYSAIIVVAPLIIPLGAAYGVNPVHLGIIFLANLQLGYLTPPVGINLFLASYRFEEPLVKIYKDVFGFLVFLLISVLLITYVPWITTFLLDIIKF